MLQVPIAYQHENVADVRVRLIGDVSVPRDGLRRLLDSLLRSQGLVSWDAPPGEEGLITIAQTGTSSRHRIQGVRQFGHQVIPAGKLDEQPARLTALYTAVFQLTYIDCRAVMSSLNPFLGSEGEMVRSVEGSNSLIVTSFSMGTLREIRDLIALIDVESTAVAQPTPIEARLAKLEARLAELEQAAASSADPSAGQQR
jgi:hypothetical protein